jgi:hypothetical protein
MQYTVQDIVDLLCPVGHCRFIILLGIYNSLYFVEHCRFISSCVTLALHYILLNNGRCVKLCIFDIDVHSISAVGCTLVILFYTPIIYVTEI